MNSVCRIVAARPLRRQAVTSMGALRLLQGEPRDREEVKLFDGQSVEVDIADVNAPRLGHLAELGNLGLEGGAGKSIPRCTLLSCGIAICRRLRSRFIELHGRACGLPTFG